MERRCIYTNKPAKAARKIIPSSLDDTQIHNHANKAPVCSEVLIRSNMANEISVLEFDIHKTYMELELLRLQDSFAKSFPSNGKYKEINDEIAIKEAELDKLQKDYVARYGNEESRLVIKMQQNASARKEIELEKIQVIGEVVSAINEKLKEEKSSKMPDIAW